MDSAGALVGDQLTYVDDAGVLWPLDLETGRVDRTALHLLSNRLFTSSDCTGPAYVKPPAPRQVFDMLDDQTLRSRRDAAALADVTIHSGMSGGVCGQVTANTQSLVSFDAMDVVALPALSFVGPLHRELR